VHADRGAGGHVAALAWLSPTRAPDHGWHGPGRAGCRAGGAAGGGLAGPEDSDGDDDAELDGRDLICDRLLDEVSWLRQCSGWLTRRALVVIDLPRVTAILDRIAADIDKLARARRVQDLATAAVLPDLRAERRRRLAEPDPESRDFCIRRRRQFCCPAVNPVTVGWLPARVPSPDRAARVWCYAG